MSDWNHSNGERYDPGYPPGYTQDSRSRTAKKSKWIAGLLAFLIPGTGHFYLAQMVKGIAIMMLIALDICSIVYAATQLNNVLIIVLLSLLMPIIYFYNLFDAVQSTDAVNDRRMHPGSFPPPPYGGVPGGPVPPGPVDAQQGPVDPLRHPEWTRRNLNGSGIILLAAGAVVLLLVSDVGWTNWAFHTKGSFAGAVLLIGAGIGLWFWERRGGQGRKG